MCRVVLNQWHFKIIFNCGPGMGVIHYVLTCCEKRLHMIDRTKMEEKGKTEGHQSMIYFITKWYYGKTYKVWKGHQSRCCQFATSGLDQQIFHKHSSRDPAVWSYCRSLYSPSAKPLWNEPGVRYQEVKHCPPEPRKAQLTQLIN